MQGDDDGPQLSDHVYQKTYVRGKGMKRYENSLKNHIPIRRKKKDTGTMAIDSAGLFSFISMSWISKFMYEAHSKGLTMEELPSISPYDACDHNSNRIRLSALVPLTLVSFLMGRFFRVIDENVGGTSCWVAPPISTWRITWRSGVTTFSYTVYNSTNNCSIGFGHLGIVNTVNNRLELLWKEELAERGPGTASLSRVAWRFCRTRIFASGLVETCNVACGILSNTIFMRVLLESLQSGGSYEDGIKWALLLTASELARALFWAWSWAMNYRTALRLRSACLTLVYRRIIGVNNLGKQNVGEVINIFSNDAQRIFDMMYYGPLIIQAPISTVCGVLYILYLFGPMALFGMVAFILYFPVQYAISQLTGYLQNKMVKISDMRVRLMNEILDCIKLIKMYAWEKRFRDDLQGIRKKEQRVIFKTSYWQSLNVAIAGMVPVISTIVTIIAHVSTGHNLTAAQVFPYTSFLNTRFRLALGVFQEGLEAIVTGHISLNRMKNLLVLEDGKECTVSKPKFKSQAVGISNGTFAYNNSDDDENEEGSLVNKVKRKGGLNKLEDKSEMEKLNETTVNTNVLFDISFEAAKGKLVGICGQVGSGKSSLLLAALGQLRVSKGQVMRDGSCAYVSQQAWITNATLRENILFGEKFDHSRYHKTIYACNLSQDIGMMPGGDQTEIGEKGVNLSGGQKQRVALARALYADRDIYFLDDPLSAVDSRVGSHIFDNLILGALKGKTVLFVTHHIQYLNRCDDIYMMRDGKIIEHGTHDELMKLGNEYALMVTAISVDNETENETIVDQNMEAHPQSAEDIPISEGIRSHADSISSHYSTKSVADSNTPDVPLTLTVDDHLHQGTVKAQTYHSYIVAAGGYFSILFVILMFLLSVGSTAFSSWWLALWIQAGGGNTTIEYNNVTILSENINDNPDFWYYQAIYAATSGVMILTSLLRSWVFTTATMRASTKIHSDLFNKIIGCPTRFFDTTPSGRIQHLFSRDMDEVDNRLPFILAYFLQNLLIVFFAVLVICLVLPWFVLPMCIIAGIYYFIAKIFRVAIRELKRMDDKSRAPVISFVTATLQGLSTIHAFGKENDFTKKFTHLFDENSKYLFMRNLATRWVATRIDGLSVVITGVTAVLVVAFQDQVPPTLAGLALTYSAQISGVFEYTVRFVTETEVRFTSVERINHYVTTLESEDNASQATLKAPPTWPAAATIKFTNVNMAYGDGYPLVLKNVSFSVDAKEKIGIVGRTGSGKSSLIVALFRIVELAEGKIEIDDMDISEISLSQLRAKLSIIPQDPVLFSGTIRSNLDPFQRYADAEIWKALENTELKGKVQSITGQLDASVGFGGDNLSVGEKQLLCLARALLRNSKILVMDEATAAVDPETEIAVQNTVQREFSNCTILTIAHRLETVVLLDRVLVMGGGKVLEFDTPSNLLGDRNSEFFKMMAAAEQAES